MSGGVSATGVLDLHDIRTEESQHLTAGRACLHMSQVQYFHIFKRSVHVVVLPVTSCLGLYITMSFLRRQSKNLDLQNDRGIVSARYFTPFSTTSEGF
jgi:hypothetical protein